MVEFYAAWNKDNDVLQNSSSGGIFTALAEYVIEKKGVVAGAYFDQDNRSLKHIVIKDILDLQKLRGSKYFQSEVYDVYNEIIEHIKKGTWVLFSGTACQIEALLALTGKLDTSKLITVDILCHGVTSRKVVEKYITSQERKYKKSVKEMKFRTKRVPWENGGGTSVQLQFTDGTIRVIDRKTDSFFMGFNFDLFLREACYQCRFIGVHRKADFTLADFWGVKEELVGKEHLKTGVSLVLVNTDKGRSIWSSDEIVKRVEYVQADPDTAICHNSALRSHRKENPRREYFFNNLENVDFDKLIHKCLRIYFVKNRIKKILRYKS